MNTVKSVKKRYNSASPWATFTKFCHQLATEWLSDSKDLISNAKKSDCKGLLLESTGNIFIFLQNFINRDLKDFHSLVVCSKW